MFQGQYNALCRDVEQTLLPLLREHKISFTAYSPLGGGFLTGNFTDGKNVEGTRFDDSNPGAAMYKAQYDKPEMHDAIRRLQKSAHAYRMSLSEMSLRWLYHHSALRQNDGFILGATKATQVQQNVMDVGKGPLAKELVGLFDTVWDEVKAKRA